jgi:hypothetical protein
MISPLFKPLISKKLLVDFRPSTSVSLQTSQFNFLIKKLLSSKLNQKIVSETPVSNKKLIYSIYFNGNKKTKFIDQFEMEFCF